MSFQVGQHVLIIGGATERDRSLVGNDTIVVGHTRGHLIEQNWRIFPINLVTETLDIGGRFWRYVYRDCDLMSLDPGEELEDEMRKERQRDKMLAFGIRYGGNKDRLLEIIRGDI